MFFYKQKKQKKLLKSRLHFKKITNFTSKLLQNTNSWNANFQDIFETHKQSFISAFSIWKTLPLR